MSCPERLRTQAFIDGEVAGSDAAAAERHIEDCAECQAFCDDAATLSDAIRLSATRHAAPAGLRRRVNEMLEAERVEVARSGWRAAGAARARDRKSTRLNSSHVEISYAVFCLKKKSTPAT